MTRAMPTRDEAVDAIARMHRTDAVVAARRAGQPWGVIAKSVRLCTTRLHQVVYRARVLGEDLADTPVALARVLAQEQEERAQSAYNARQRGERMHHLRHVPPQVSSRLAVDHRLVEHRTMCGAWVLDVELADARQPVTCTACRSAETRRTSGARFLRVTPDWRLR